jgi:hypothetical protein
MLILPDNTLILGVWSPWDLWILGMFANLIGSMFFAIATYQARVLSSRAATTLGLSSGAGLLVGIGSWSGNYTDLTFVLMVGSIGAFAASWVWLGISALRRGPIRAIAAA